MCCVRSEQGKTYTIKIPLLKRNADHRSEKHSVKLFFFSAKSRIMMISVLEICLFKSVIIAYKV